MQQGHGRLSLPVFRRLHLPGGVIFNQITVPRTGPVEAPFTWMTGALLARAMTPVLPIICRFTQVHPQVEVATPHRH